MSPLEVGILPLSWNIPLTASHITAQYNIVGLVDVYFLSSVTR